MRCGRMRCGDIWRCGGPKKKENQLLSYEEILELANASLAEAEAELNKYPEQYFDKFNSEGHMIFISEVRYELNGTTITYFVDEKHWGGK